MRIPGNRPRVTSRALAVALAACLALTACGSDEEGAVETPETQTSAPATDAATVDEPEPSTESTTGTTDVPTTAGGVAGDPGDVLAAAAGADIAGDVVKLGLISVTEGSAFASNGQRTVEGAQRAVEEINEAGGIGGVPIELVFEDTKGSAEAMANIIRKLAAEDEVLAVVGPILSGECEVGCPLANQLGLPILAPGVGKPGVVEAAGEFIFKLVADDNVHTGDSLAPLLESEGAETAVIMKDELDPTSNFMGSQFWPGLFDRVGIELLDELTFTTGDADFSAQVTRLGELAPDVVALAAGPSDAANIAIEMQRQGVDIQLLGSGGLQSAGNDFISAGGDAVEGTIMAAQFDPAPSDAAQASLIETYEQATGTEVTLNAAYAYDAVYILVDEIISQGVTNDPADLEADRTRIKEGLPSISGWVGMGGPTTLNVDGTVTRQPQIARIVDGVLTIEQVG